MSRWMRLLAVGALVFAAILPAGCLSSVQQADDGSMSAQAPGVAVAPLPPSADRTAPGADGGVAVEEYALTAEDKVASGGSDAGRAIGAEPLIIRNGSVELRVDDVEKALPAIRSAVTANGADIAEMSVSGGVQESPEAPVRASGPTYATITIRVPADRLSALTTAVTKLGDVVTQAESSSDVTEQAVDMEARLKNLRAEEARLRTFLDRADKIDDLLAVQRELSRVRGDIEAMDAQLTYLKRQVARATLIVTLSEPGPVVGPDDPWYGIREAFVAGIRGALEVVQVIITFTIAVLPLAAVLALTAWIIARLVMRRRSRRSASDDMAPVEAVPPQRADGDGAEGSTTRGEGQG